MSVQKENQNPNQPQSSLGGASEHPVAESARQEDVVEKEEAPPKDPRLRRRALPNPLINDLLPNHLRRGVLIPLQTTQEVRQDHTIVQALITRAPTKSANDVIT